MKLYAIGWIGLIRDQRKQQFLKSEENDIAKSYQLFRKNEFLTFAGIRLCYLRGQQIKYLSYEDIIIIDNIIITNYDKSS